jgi:hypothetical protein
MKINLFLFVFLFFAVSFLRAQKKDSVYYVQCISKDTREEIPFAEVTAISNGVKIAGWTTDLDGVVKIQEKEIQGNTSVQIIAHYVGYKPVSFPSLALRLNDTLVMVLQNSTNQLDEIVLVAYKEPLIDPDTKSTDKKRRHKKETPEIKAPEQPPIYSQQQLNDYDSLKNGKWKMTDSMPPKIGIGLGDFYLYLKKYLHYPQAAIDNNIEGIVYMQFTIDQNGYLQNITVLHGDVILSLEVAKALAGIDRIIIEQYVEGKRVYEPQTYTLPVKFVLES